MKKSIITLFILTPTLIFAQNKNGLVPSSSPMPVVKFSVDERKQSPSLQEFVESIYTNAVAVLEEGKSMYKYGEFPVYVFNRHTNSFKLIETKDLNQYKTNQIKSFKYSKSAADTALFGARIEAIGLVYIEIDQ